MEEFEPMKVNTYSIKELADMIEQGKVTQDEIYGFGLAAPKRPDLETELMQRKMLVIEDEEQWDLAQKKHTVEGYDYYLSQYDKFPPEYRGKHVAEAKAARDGLIKKLKELRQELYQTMREQPWIFKADGVKKLLSGAKDLSEIMSLRQYKDITSRFLASGQKITYEELVQEQIIPPSIPEKSITAEDMNLRQTNINQLGDFPVDKRTDVYFVGVPRGGKSSVLAGILSNMFKRGIAVYQPHWNQNKQDLVNEYYNGLIEATQKGKFPVSTGDDTISFMKLDLMLNRRTNHLTFVEIGGEAFRKAASTKKAGADAWGDLGAGTCLQSKNQKLLFFVLDYGACKGLNDEFSEIKQSQILDDVLRILTSDGQGKDFSEGCTLSKVDSVAVIVTKSDLMDTDNRKRREELAVDYVHDNFAAFMRNLTEKCRRFGINKPTRYNPYVLTFSLGKLLIGNTYAYDPTDSEEIVSFISDATVGHR